MPPQPYVIRMPRQPRTHLPNAILHVTSRGVEKRLVYLCERDNLVFLKHMSGAIKESDASLFAYCLMGNHFHMLIAVREAPLSGLMHRLLTRYSLYFNRTYARVGHLFQGRYWAEHCEDLGYLINLAAYIHKNPVRAGLVPDVAKWPWSSHHEFVSGGGQLIDLSRLEEITGMTPEALCESYIERIGAVSTPPEPSKDIREVIRQVAEKHGIGVGALLSGQRGATMTRVKSELVAWADRNGIPDDLLASVLNCSASAISQIRRRSCHFRA